MLHEFEPVPGVAVGADPLRCLLVPGPHDGDVVVVPFGDLDGGKGDATADRLNEVGFTVCGLLSGPWSKICVDIGNVDARHALSLASLVVMMCYQLVSPAKCWGRLAFSGVEVLGPEGIETLNGIIRESFSASVFDAESVATFRLQ